MLSCPNAGASTGPAWFVPAGKDQLRPAFTLSLSTYFCKFTFKINVEDMHIRLV